MTTTITDRLYGESSGVAVKAPCVAVSVGAELPLTGLNPVGSYTPQEGDRILVKDQSNPVANGIYNASVSAWKRTGDFDGSYDCVQGTLVVVYLPNTTQLLFQLATDDPVIGTSPLNFVPYTAVEDVFPETQVEIDAGVTSPNTRYMSDWFDPRRYGAKGDGLTDDTAAMQLALNVAGEKGGTVRIPPGFSFVCESDLLVPVVQGHTVDIEGPGWTSPGIIFNGNGVTHGLYFNGPTSFDYSGAVRNLNIECQSGAMAGITYNNCNHPLIDRCLIQHAAGRGIYFLQCLVPHLARTLLTGCGSATTGSIEVDTCTDFMWLQNRISLGDPTLGGLLIDRTQNTTILGGNIESAGMLLRIGSKAESAQGCNAIFIQGLDLENPGNGNSYIDLGSGLSGAARVQSAVVQGNSGFPSGTTSIPYAVVMKQCIGVDFLENQWSQAGASPVSTHELVGTSNLGIRIHPHRASFGNTWPWVRRNGAMVKAAGPFLDWFSDSIPVGLKSPGNSLTGTTPSVSTLASQGGYYGLVLFHNTSATTVASLTDVEPGMELTFGGSDSNTTLHHNPGGTGRFNLIGGADLLLTNGKFYKFVVDISGNVVQL